MGREYATVYDQAGRLLAVLENADAIGYDLKHNDLWTGQLTLPADDPKNTYCAAHNLVRLPDGPRDTGFFRIIGIPNSEETAQGGTVTYSVEHVMATLLDDILFSYHEIGGEGITTAQVIEYILSFQTVQRWQLGACEFYDEYAYKFENTSLLSALLSLGGVLTPDSFTWDFDTSTTPWTVNLRKADDAPGCGIRYARNMVGIEKTMDATTHVTRLYPLGYGEGVNQLTIRSVNGGIPYIDADTVGVWGTKSAPFVDTRIEDAATLLARARAVLETVKNPYICYVARAIDLYRITGQEWDKYMPGKLVHCFDSEHGIDFRARIVGISKASTLGDPGDIVITIANAARDTADSLNTLADRVGIGELYSQGATNLFAIPFADNADTDHPAAMRVYIPRGLVRINQMLLSWRLAPFRAYETAAAAGGATTRTSSSGGGNTETTSSSEDVTYTSETSGEASITAPIKISCRAAVSAPIEMGTTDTQMSLTYGMIDDTTGPSSLLTTDSGGGSVSTGEAGGAETGSAGSHTHTCYKHGHTISNHSHSYSGTIAHNWGHRHDLLSSDTATTTGGVEDYANKSKTLSYSGTTGGKTLQANEAGDGDTGSAGSHTHTAPAHRHKMGSHTHGMEHTHSIPAHEHGFRHRHNVTMTFEVPALEIEVPAHGHNVKIPGHKHSVNVRSHSHSIDIPEHTHEIEYGIFEGATAKGVTIEVDGMAIPAGAIDGAELDIAAYLAKDDDGKITRGAWHEIKIIPDTLTRIEANLFAQAFIQSVGGGDY